MVVNKKQDRSNSKRLILDFLFAILISFLLIGFYQYTKLGDSLKEQRPEVFETKIENANKNLKYGFNLNEYQFSSMTLKPNEFIGDILLQNGISYQDIAILEKKAEDIFSVRKIRAGKELSIIKKEKSGQASCVIYEPSPFQYVVYDFRDSIGVRLVDKDFVTCTETASGIVETSLWNAMTDRGFSPALIDKMEEALAWSVDFYHTNAGDEFKLIYEQIYIDGKAVSIGKLLAAYYKTNIDHYAIYFENEKYGGYYDLEGRPSKKAFLAAPVKFSRISSRYSGSRYHPILKRRKAHLGTDYAAPYGTPIQAVGNGVVLTASYTSGNGKFVKIKHDETYQTQYLHMSKFAKGIHSGVHVNQGDVIGYVGSTGLATGPHVCFRFWKNGKQVDHMKQNFPPPDPMRAEDMPRFLELKESMVNLLNQIPIEDLGETSDLIVENLIQPNQP